MPFEIPESWAWCRLLDVCHIFGRIGFRGYTKEDLVHSGGAITLSPSNIVNGRMSYDNCTYISWDKYEESPEIQISNNDILLVKTGSSYGKCALVTDLPQAATINPQFVVLKYISYNAALLRYVLQSNYARSNYERFVLGTAIPTFTQVVLGDMLIPLPPANEQIKIIKEIDRWFAIIDEIESGTIELESYVKQTKSKILDHAISGKLVPQDHNDEPAIELLKRINPKFEPCDNSHYENLPFEVPDGWCWATLGSIGKWQSGATPSRMRKDYYGGDIPWLKTGDLNDWYITDIPEYITQQALNETSVKLNPAGSILIAMYGATIGKIGILTMPATTNQACCACISHNGIEQMYLFYYLLSHKEEFVRQGGGGAQPNISKEKIVETLIPIPPLSEQLRIIKAIEAIFNKIDNITAELS